MPSTTKDLDAGSRMHVLDWLETEDFIPALQQLVATTGFTVPHDGLRQPRGRIDPSESTLTGTGAPFLSASQKAVISEWWLVHSRGSKLPTWDLVARARDGHGQPALILVEAKAHRTELKSDGKARAIRKSIAEQARSDANHEKIGAAIHGASAALRNSLPGIAISRDASYQFSNRIAFAWKLASLGVPVALIYLGFIGDQSISPKEYIQSIDHWRTAFLEHVEPLFPWTGIEREISCGESSFWLLVRTLDVARQSPPLMERRQVRQPGTNP